MTSTRDARAAGISDARTAAAIRIDAAPATGGALDGLLRGQLANDACDRWHQRVRVAARVDEEAAAADLLLEGMIDAERRSRHDVLVVDVSRNADDAPRAGTHVDELHDGIGPHEVAVQPILILEHPLRQALAHDE